jgi:serine/threonine protein kinase
MPPSKTCGELDGPHHRAEARLDQPSATPLEATLTRTGAALGTIGYMSPEQVRGEKLDLRTDLFSLGLVLYEMATGQRAFSGQTQAVLHNQILNSVPAPVHEAQAARNRRRRRATNRAGFTSTPMKTGLHRPSSSAVRVFAGEVARPRTRNVHFRSN